jgi:Skp family chaperone for outer membrane proteins
LWLCFFLALAPSSAIAQAAPPASPKSEYEETPSSELLTRLHGIVSSLTSELANITKRSAELEAKIQQLETAQTEQEAEQTRLSESLRSCYAERDQLQAEKARIEKELRTSRLVILSLVILFIGSMFIR